jgi:hypothetical protein
MWLRREWSVFVYHVWPVRRLRPWQRVVNRISLWMTHRVLARLRPRACRHEWTIVSMRSLVRMGWLTRAQSSDAQTAPLDMREP